MSWTLFLQLIVLMAVGSCWGVVLVNSIVNNYFEKRTLADKVSLEWGTKKPLD